jgi:hypothetical protein
MKHSKFAKLGAAVLVAGTLLTACTSTTKETTEEPNTAEGIDINPVTYLTGDATIENVETQDEYLQLDVVVTLSDTDGTFTDKLDASTITFAGDLSAAQGVKVNAISDDGKEAEIWVTIPQGELVADDLSFDAEIDFAQGSIDGQESDTILLTVLDYSNAARRTN